MENKFIEEKVENIVFKNSLEKHLYKEAYRLGVEDGYSESIKHYKQLELEYQTLKGLYERAVK